MKTTNTTHMTKWGLEYIAHTKQQQKNTDCELPLSFQNLPSLFGIILAFAEMALWLYLYCHHYHYQN